MKDFVFSNDAFYEYLSWQTEDRKTLKRINALLKDIQTNGALQGIGKPEKLKYRKGYSRRIDDVNRLIYEIDTNQNIIIISCRGHYDD